MARVVRRRPPRIKGLAAELNRRMGLAPLEQLELAIAPASTSSGSAPARVPSSSTPAKCAVCGRWNYHRQGCPNDRGLR